MFGRVERQQYWLAQRAEYLRLKKGNGLGMAGPGQGLAWLRWPGQGWALGNAGQGRDGLGWAQEVS